jgi:hypothetical protein
MSLIVKFFLFIIDENLFYSGKWLNIKLKRLKFIHDRG